MIIGLFSIDWVRAVFLAIMGVGILAMAAAYVVQGLAIVFDAAAHFWRSTHPAGSHAGQGLRHLHHSH